MAGFGVLITFGFFIYIVSWYRSQLVGLGIRFSSLLSPPIPGYVTYTNVTYNFI